MKNQEESSTQGEKGSESIPYQSTKEYNPLAFQAMQSQIEFLMKQIQESNEKMDARLARIETSTIQTQQTRVQPQRHQPQRNREEWGDEVNFDPT